MPNHPNTGKNYAGRGLSLVLVMIVLSWPLQGCAALRQKFVRKHKESQQTPEMEPILSPINYPAPVETPKTVYQESYQMWKAWHTELGIAFSERDSDKRVLFILGRLLMYTGRMEKLVAPPQDKAWQHVGELLRQIKQDMELPAPLRQMSRVQSTFRASGRIVREDLRPSRVKTVKATGS